LKILITSFFYPPQIGGVGEVVARHAMGLSSLGHEITVATSFVSGRSTSNVPQGIKVESFDVQGNGNLRVAYSGETEKYQNYILNSSFDVIVCHGLQTWSTNLAFPLLSKLSAKSILVSHGVSVNTMPDFPRNLLHWLAWRPYVWKMPRILKSFDHIVFLSEKCDRDRFYDRYIAKKIDYRSCSTIPNGAPLLKFSNETLSFRRTYEITSKYIVLSISNFSPLKNQMGALRAFHQAGNLDATMVFIGSKKNDYSTKLEDLSKTLGIHERIRILEFSGLEMKLQALCASDLFLFTSRTETQPLVLLEAMGAGIPFLSLPVGCVEEFPGGRIADNIHEMSTSLRQMLSDPVRLKEIGRQGRHAVEEKYNWNVISSRYNALIGSL
jgi:glycosyltransferase involved in cell wall biosynthesis